MSFRFALRPVVEYMLERADQRLTPETVAAAFGISKRTLHDRLVSGGLPATGATIMWTRMLTASALLDQPGNSLGSVADQLQFHDHHNLGTTIYRYAGAGVRELRPRGVLETALESFRTDLVSIREMMAAEPARLVPETEIDSALRVAVEVGGHASLPERSSAD